MTEETTPTEPPGEDDRDDGAWRDRLVSMVDTRERRLELFVTILLAIATVATAWSSYQSARWSGLQAINFSKSNATRVESTRLSSEADTQTQIDVATFIAWIDAFAQEDEKLQEFYFNRFRAEFKPAVEAWVATKPRTNPNAPLSPFAMPEYSLEARNEADKLVAAAEAATEQAKVDNQRSDNYVLAVVLFASSLFFAGISTKLDAFRFKATILTIGWLLFLGTLIWVATFPITVSV